MYLLLAPGLFFHHSSLSGPGNSKASATLSGVGFGLDIALGATIAPGLVLGGNYGQHSGGSATLATSTGVSTSGVSLEYRFLAIFVEYYPNRHGGLHVGGALGRAYLDVERLTLGPTAPTVRGNPYNATELSTLTGFHGHFQVGYGGFVSDQWSIGVIGRIQLAHTSDDTTGSTALVVTPSLSLAFTYH